METNEQGLTNSERIMFLILGIILIVAVGALAFNSFSSNERELKDDTSIKEGQKDIKDESGTSSSDSSLIEETNDKKTSTSKSHIVAVNLKNKKTSTSKPIIKVDKEENDGIGSTAPDYYNSWDFKKDIVTQAYTNDILYIDRNVVLENGTEVEAQLTIRKLIDDAYEIVDISEGKIVLSEGIYKYYYTYNNVTKELELIVENKVDIDRVSLLELKEDYDKEEITEEDFISYKELLQNTQIVIENNTFNITTKTYDSSKKLLPLVVSLNEDINNDTLITTENKGVEIVRENKTWYQNLSNNQLIIWLNLETIKEDSIKIKIGSNNYILKVNLVVYNITKPTQDGKEDQEDLENEKINTGNKDQDIENKVEESLNDTQEENNLMS